MSASVVLVPVIITAWPMLAASITAAAVSAGFHIVKEDKKTRKTTNIEITMENMDVVAESLSHDDKIVVERAGITVTFSRDAKGQFKTCVDGNMAKEELTKIGEELAGKVIQQYVYRRLAHELQSQGFVTLEEDKGPDEAIKLTVRRYEEA